MDLCELYNDNFHLDELYTRNGLELRDQVIDLLTLNGKGITTIEKASGIVIANEFNFINAYCFEKDRKPEKGGKFIIIAPVKYGEVNLMLDQVLTDWNVKGEYMGDTTMVTSTNPRN